MQREREQERERESERERERERERSKCDIKSKITYRGRWRKYGKAAAIAFVQVSTCAETGVLYICMHIMCVRVCSFFTCVCV